MKLDFVGPTYQSRSSNFDAQRCVNFYPELDKTGKDVIALIGTPGFTSFASVGSDFIRGVHYFNKKLYVVSGYNLYSITSNKVVSAVLGTLSTNYSQVSMADNGLSPTGGDQLIIVDGSKGYIYNVNTSTFTVISSGFPTTGADTVTFMDGYFIVNKGGSSGVFYVSALYDGLTWSSLDKSTVDANPDNLLAVFANNRELWLFGEISTEIWYDTGTGHPPFQRIPGGVIETGTAARWSIAKTGNNLIWLSRDKNGKSQVVINEGYGIRIISNPALEYQWSTYTDISNAIGFCYSSEGHTFYVLTFPVGDATFVYDLTTDMWHERSSYKDSPFTIRRWIANGYVNFEGMHIITDSIDGDLYLLSSNVYTENGNPIVSMRRTRHISEDLKTIFIHELKIDMETGVGDGSSLDVTVPGGSANPQSMLRWSDDGGHTWSNEKYAAMGQIGQYTTRVIYRRLGRTRDRVFELSISEPVKKVIIGASMEASIGL